MIWIVNACGFAFAAVFWHKVGALNILASTVLTGLAVVNAALAAPTVMAWLP